MTRELTLDAASVLSLDPDHLADLRASGLCDEMITAAGIMSVPPADLSRYVGPRLAALVTSAYLIPYPQTENFYRAKLFPSVSDGNGQRIRYYQPPGTAPHLYIGSRTRAVLADPSFPIRWVEGEKKSLRAEQEGLPCVGLGGLWSWLHDGQPLVDLDRIDHVGRTEVLTPDSDVWTRPDLLQAVYALGKELEARGARVCVEKLPAGPGGAKVGLDDSLCTRTVADLEGLPKLELKHAAFSRTAEWWKGWRKRRSDGPGPPVGALDLLERGETVCDLHPAQDVLDGVLWYGVPVAGKLVLISSRREAHEAGTLPAGLRVRHADLTSSTVTREVALRWLSGDARGSVGGALDAVGAFLARYVILRHPTAPLLLAAWVVGSWCYRAVRVFAHLRIGSPEKRCGKTRLLTILSKLAFNASPVTAIPTEALLFRKAAQTGGAQFLDEVESLRGDKDRFEALISVLNVGFERGSVVSRLEKRGDRFVEVPYEVFAPRALAGIAGLKDTLEDRSIPVFMARKRREERVARLGTTAETEALALREACALACLTHIAHILTGYDQAPALLEREALDDRAVDLWAPLVALTVVADAEDGGDRTPRLLGLARELAGLRDADADAGHTARLLEALHTIRRERGEVLTPGDLLETLRARPGWEWVKSEKRLAMLLNPLGLFRVQRPVGERRRWVYLLDLAQLADLRDRYGAAEPAPETP